jgi:hypothetical protein
MVKRKILFRFDDICPTMNWNLWDKVEEILDKYEIKPLLGVIPDCKDTELTIMPAKSDFWIWLSNKQKEGYTIAMHGCNHIFSSNSRGILTTRKGSEFAGLSYEEQLKKIKKGKDILESHGIHTNIFFAPGHSYDENTIKALKVCGFKYISDGKSSKAYVWHDITFLPCRNSGALMRAGEKYSTSIYHVHEWTDPNKDAFNTLINIIETTENVIVNFEDYKKQPIGNFFVQRTIELFYVFLQFKIAPFVRYVKKLICIV